MAMNAETLDLSPSYLPTRLRCGSPRHPLSSRSRHTPQALQIVRPTLSAQHAQHDLDSSQRATLGAIADLLAHPGSCHIPSGLTATATQASHAVINLSAGLYELDTIARIRAGYGFAELPAELQEAVLNLIATRDLTSPILDLALWLEDLLPTLATPNV